MQRHPWSSLAVAVVVVALTAAPAAAQKPSAAPSPAPSGVEAVAAAGNDMFGNAFRILRPGVFEGSTTSATLQPGEPRHAADNRGGHSVWFVWVPNSTRDVVINTAGSDFDTLLGVYRGRTLLTLRRIVSNDDARSGVLTSRVVFRAFAGNRYRIAVDGYRYPGQTAQTASAGHYFLRLANA